MKFKTTGTVGGERREVEAVQWDGSVEGAYTIFDFTDDVTDCRITDEGDFLLYPKGINDEAVVVEPGNWIIRYGPGRYFVATVETMRRKFVQADEEVAS